MSAAALLTRLQNAGASIRHHDGKLLVRAPSGRLTPDLVEELRHRKPLLLAILAGDHCRISGCDRLAPTARRRLRGRHGRAPCLLRGGRGRAPIGGQSTGRRKP